MVNISRAEGKSQRREWIPGKKKGLGLKKLFNVQEKKRYRAITPSPGLQQCHSTRHVQCSQK